MPSAPRRRLLAGIALACFANVLLEILMVRLFSAMMFYHFTFVAVALALLGLAFFVPQTIVVPALQAAINRRAQDRILVKREASGSIANSIGGETSRTVQAAIGRVFSLNMGIYRFKYAMNLFMNLMHHFSVAAALCVGGWMVFEGRIEVGTVVAIAGGLGKLNDPWGDLVNWARELSVVDVKYRLYVDALDRLSASALAQSRDGPCGSATAVTTAPSIACRLRRCSRPIIPEPMIPYLTTSPIAA